MHPLKPITILSLFIAIFCLQFLPGFVLHTSEAETLSRYIKTNKNNNITFKNKQISFYGLTIKFKKSRDGLASHNVEALYQGKALIKAEDANTADTLDLTEIADNFPGQGMATLVLKLFDGGASCCWSQEIFTFDGITVRHLSIPIGKGGSYTAIGDNGLLNVYDSSLSNFSEYLTDDIYISYMPALNPSPHRFLIFENSHWRVDKENEFPELYKQLIQQTKALLNVNSSDEDRHIAAAQESYYCLMAGDPAQECFIILENTMPKAYRPLAKPLFAAVASSVTDFTIR